MGKLPAFLFYPADWTVDTRCLSLEAKGAWIELLCAMWRAPRRGQLRLPLSAMARIMGVDLDCASRVLAELAATGVAELGQGVGPLAPDELVSVACRRMLREQDERESARGRKQLSRARTPQGADAAPTPDAHGGPGGLPQARAVASQAQAEADGGMSRRGHALVTASFSSSVADAFADASKTKDGSATAHGSPQGASLQRKAGTGQPVSAAQSQGRAAAPAAPCRADGGRLIAAGVPLDATNPAGTNPAGAAQADAYPAGAAQADAYPAGPAPLVAPSPAPPALPDVPEWLASGQTDERAPGLHNGLTPGVPGIPCTKGCEFVPTPEQLAELCSAFPGVDVPQEFAEMRAWSLANPSRKKTLKGALAFATRWLAKEQDRAGSRHPRREAGPAVTPRSYAQMADAERRGLALAVLRHMPPESDSPGGGAPPPDDSPDAPPGQRRGPSPGCWPETSLGCGIDARHGSWPGTPQARWPDAPQTRWPGTPQSVWPDAQPDSRDHGPQALSSDAAPDRRHDPAQGPWSSGPAADVPGHPPDCAREPQTWLADVPDWMDGQGPLALAATLPANMAENMAANTTENLAATPPLRREESSDHA